MRKTDAAGGKASRSVMDNNKIVFVLSLLIAVVCWGAISMVNTKETEGEVSGVKVQLVQPEEWVQKYGLSVYDVKEEDLLANVKVKGYSYLLRNLRPEDIVLTVNCSSAVTAGRRSLNVVRSLADNVNPNVQIVSVEPDTINLYFDTEETKSFPITEDIVEKPGYAIAEGYERENPILTPETVTITGPSGMLSKITSVKARAELNKTLNARQILEAELILETDEGELDKKDFTIQPDPPYDITIPVSYTSTCNTKVEFTNAPADYKTNMLPWTVTPATVQVKTAVSEDTPQTRSPEISIGTVDFSDIVPEEVNTVVLTFDAGGGEGEYEVEIDATGFVSRTLSVPVDISNITLPANVRVTTAEIAEVTVAGPAASVEALERASVYAVPVTEGLSALTAGQYSVPAKFVFRTATDCWVYGKYTVDVTVQ